LIYIRSVLSKSFILLGVRELLLEVKKSPLGGQKLLSGVSNLLPEVGVQRLLLSRVKEIHLGVYRLLLEVQRILLRKKGLLSGVQELLLGVQELLS
jgi:hypothetical protein